MKKMLCFFLMFMAILLSATPFKLINGDVASDIVISSNASESTKKNASILAKMLRRITGKEFKIVFGDGATGIVLGLQQNFPALPKTFETDTAKHESAGEHMIYSHPQGVLLVAGQELGVQNALWSFLGKLGFRQYYPGRAWEIVPKTAEPSIDCDEVRKPSFFTRRIWYGFGTYPERTEDYRDWCVKNLAISELDISTGHYYDAFIRKNQEIFKKHPEYYALVGGVRKGPKICISNPELRELFVKTKVEEVKHASSNLKRRLDCTSVDPSDGGGWCECEECAKMGSVSDRAVTLANLTAKAIRDEFPGVWVGMYAYYMHSEPPSIKIEPNVVVLAATAFRNTWMTMEEQMSSWHNQGATMGIRDYLSYAAANYDLPNRLSVMSYKTLAKRFKQYHNWGARFYSAEAGDNWVPLGFVYYTAQRLLWNVDDTAFIDTLFDDFLRDCFGPCAEDVRVFYNAISREGNPLLTENLVHRLYAALHAARQKFPGEEIEERLDALTAYARYIELYIRSSEARGEEKYHMSVEMFQHLYRARHYPSNHAYAVIRDMTGRNKTLWQPDDRKYFSVGRVPYLDKEDYTPEELRAFEVEGMENNKKLDYDMVSYSTDLIPALPLLKTETDLEKGQLGGHHHHSAMLLTYADKPNTEWRVKFTHNGRQENIRPQLEIWADANALVDTPVDIVNIALEKGESGEVVVKSPHTGIHQIRITGARWITPEYDPERYWTSTTEASYIMISQAYLGGCTLYFYVPTGTKFIGGHYIGGNGIMFRPDGSEALKMRLVGYFKIEVPEGMDGRLWKAKNFAGKLDLFTVPPYFAESPQQLLLPREVVERELKLMEEKTNK